MKDRCNSRKTIPDKIKYLKELEDVEEEEKRSQNEKCGEGACETRQLDYDATKLARTSRRTSRFWKVLK